MREQRPVGTLWSGGKEGDPERWDSGFLGIRDETIGRSSTTNGKMGLERVQWFRTLRLQDQGLSPITHMAAHTNEKGGVGERQSVQVVVLLPSSCAE